MSIESARLFFKRMETDKKFAQKFNECKDAEARLAFVKDTGIDFTGQEINEVFGELSDADLDNVIGGTSFSSGTFGSNPYGKNNNLSDYSGLTFGLAQSVVVN